MYHDSDPDTGEKLVVVEILKQLPRELSLMIGDALHNLRSALDNLAYELAVAYTSPLPSHKAELSEFPIFHDANKYANDHTRKIGAMHPDAQDEITKLQPYQLGAKYRSDRLWVLHELSRVDKHRLPHLTMMVPVSVSFFPLEPTGLPAEIACAKWDLGPIEEKKVIVRYETKLEHPDAKLEPRIQQLFGVGFGKEGSAAYGWEAHRTLRQIRNHIINKVLPSLTCFL